MERPRFTFNAEVPKDREIANEVPEVIRALKQRMSGLTITLADYVEKGSGVKPTYNKDIVEEYIEELDAYSSDKIAKQIDEWLENEPRDVEYGVALRDIVNKRIDLAAEGS